MPSCTPGKGKVSKPERQLWGHLCQGQAELTTGFHPQRCLEAPLQVVDNVDNSLSCTAVPGCRTRRITGTDQNAPEGGGAAPGTLGPRRPPLRRGPPAAWHSPRITGDRSFSSSSSCPGAACAPPSRWARLSLRGGGRLVTPRRKSAAPRKGSRSSRVPQGGAWAAGSPRLQVSEMLNPTRYTSGGELNTQRQKEFFHRLTLC